MAATPDLAAGALGQPATAGIVHLRTATPGLPRTRDSTHPFRRGSVAFAHNGAITPVRRLHALVGDGPAAASARPGGTDSELYLALLTAQAAEAGDLAEGTRRAVRSLRSAFPRASLNALILTPDRLLVVHAGERAPAPASIGHDDGTYFRLHYRRSPDGALAFVSSGPAARGWEPLPPATIVCVDLRAATVERISIDAPRPAR